MIAARHRTKSTLYALATIGSVALAVTQYQEFQRRLDTGDGSGSEVPGAIFALSIGGMIGASGLWISNRGEAAAASRSEKSSLAAAQALFPERDARRR